MINSQCYEEQFNPSAVKLPQCECVYKMYIKVWIYGTAQHYGKQADPSIFSESECCFSAHFCYFHATSVVVVAIFQLIIWFHHLQLWKLFWFTLICAILIPSRWLFFSK